MVTTEKTLQAAHALIRQKRYDEARQLLVQVDHPTARNWLMKLDEIAPAQTAPAAPPPQESTIKPLASTSEVTPSQSTVSAGDKGKLLWEYGYNRMEIFRRVFFGVVFSVLGLAILWAKLGRGVERSEGALVVLAFTGFMVIAGLAIVIPALLTIVNKRRTKLYANGIERTEGTEQIFVPWDQLQKITGFLLEQRQMGITVFVTGSYDFHVDGKIAFKVSALDAYAGELYVRANEQMARIHSPRLIKALANGGSVQFGDITIQSDGVYHKGELAIPRAALGEASINNMSLFITLRDGSTWKRFGTNQLGNAWVMQAVINALARQPA